MDEPAGANVSRSDPPKIEVPDTSLSSVPPQDLSPHSSSTPTSGQPSPSTFSGQPAGKHPLYKGIRSRGNKWVSEIREPRKTTRIWLGTYPTPEMAATAYDVAALALKGAEATLNFPNSILTYPIPKSTSATDIRAAAASAAEAQRQQANTTQPIKEEATEPAAAAADKDQFIDEEELLNMPNLLVDMAEGMLVSPPRLKPQPSDDSPENSDSDSLWSYP